ncbi:hypothetical protein, partial [Kineococcus vitellinus]|uniref:hypothetical protein n=1 Tax=Kineococcus vitellinus TaxID=2696565 RepID=UPI001F0F94F7
HPLVPPATPAGPLTTTAGTTGVAGSMATTGVAGSSGTVLPRRSPRAARTSWDPWDTRAFTPVQRPAQES